MDDRTFTLRLLTQISGSRSGSGQNDFEPARVSGPALTVAAFPETQSRILRDRELQNRMVVTGSDVLSRDAEERMWILPKDAIITPLARDLAKKRDLLLELRAE